MKLSIIIVNYNVRYFLEQCLDSVFRALSGIEGEVIVVDNASDDDSVGMIRSKFPNVKLIANEKNTGFSVANNQGIEISLGEYVLLLNPDTVVQEDTFQKSIEFMDKHPEAGCLGIKMIDGAGNYLPESKRGFPTLWVAMCKALGFYRIFPGSKLMNGYYMGHLSKNVNAEVEVIAGAYMFLRKSALNKTGLLDEAFFMYGEDIDLSYRMIEQGYKNYYLAESTIIHYKGESTKKGSLNYVKTFYKAMIIFANKHFSGQTAWIYRLFIKLAIYLRATLTVIMSLFSKFFLPTLDILLIFVGMVAMKNFWATHYFNDPDYYQPSYIWFNIPLYIFIWVVSVFFSGGYDKYSNIRQIFRGIFFGTLVLAAIYGFLDLEYRPSRALVIFGAIWALIAMLILRLGIHYYKTGNFGLGKSEPRNYIIVGSLEEGKRVLNLIRQAEVNNNFIGFISPGEETESEYLHNADYLEDIVSIYKVEEIIFCARDFSSAKTIHWMTKLGNSYSFKIVTGDGFGIIGSRSRNSRGELYTIDAKFSINEISQRRNKRVFDVIISFGLFIFFPILGFIVENPFQYLKNCWHVFFNKKSWVGYCSQENDKLDLPNLKPGVLCALSGKAKNLPVQAVQRVNYLYARDYSVHRDLDLVWRNIRELGS